MSLSTPVDTGDVSQEVVVIGGGVIGLFTAWELVKAGRRVRILEREPSLLHSCASGSAGMIVPSHIIPMAAPGMPQLGLRMMLQPNSPFYIQPRADAALLDWGWKFLNASKQTRVDKAAPILRDLHFASHRLYREFAEETKGAIGLTEHGSLILTRTEKGLREEGEVARYAERQGVQAHVLTPEEVRRIDPGVTMDIGGGIHYPQDAHLSPAHTLECLVGALKDAGARWETDAETLGWRREGNTVIAARTHNRSFEADAFVIAGGSWSGALCQSLGIRIPLMPGRGYSWTVQAPIEKPRLCAILHEARVAVTPIQGTLRFGGTMELTRPDSPPNLERARQIIGGSLEFYPRFKRSDFEGLEPWSGLRPCSPDGLPYIGRFRATENVYFGGGHGMMGLSLGPITGRLLAQAITGETPEIDAPELAPDRYST